MATDGDHVYHGEHWGMYWIVKSLCCKPKTNTKLYVNYTSVMKRDNGYKITDVLFKQ